MVHHRCCSGVCMGPLDTTQSCTHSGRMGRHENQTALDQEMVHRQEQRVSLPTRCNCV